MAKRISIKPGEPVGLKLTPEERNLLLESVVILDEELEGKLRLVVAGEHQVQLTLDELEDLAGCIAAEANHTKDRKLGKKLDRIFQRIERLEDMFEEAG